MYKCYAQTDNSIEHKQHISKYLQAVAIRLSLTKQLPFALSISLQTKLQPRELTELNAHNTLWGSRSDKVTDKGKVV